MKNVKIIAGILLFGSLWGFSEVIIGSEINELGLPSGAIMTGFFALFFLVFSRIMYRKPGMQMGIALVAGTLRLFNPFAGCHLCSAIAIMAEGAVFEIIWNKISLDFSDISTLRLKSSMGVITAYLIYICGFIVTQILTPIVYGTTFYIENLIVFIPNILGSGIIAALIGLIVLPITFYISDIKLSLKDTFYYPTTLGISLICWFVVVGNWFFA
jgi:hypothetical protein